MSSVTIRASATGTQTASVVVATDRPRRGGLWLVSVLVMVVSLGACSGDDTYLPALLADPMADYEADGLELSESWEYGQSSGFLGSGPVQAEVGRTYGIDDQDQAARLLEEAAEFAESEGWTLRGSLTGRPDFYSGVKELAPGSARLSVALGAVDAIDDPDGPRQLAIRIEFDPVPTE